MGHQKGSKRSRSRSPSRDRKDDRKRESDRSDRRRRDDDEGSRRRRRDRSSSRDRDRRRDRKVFNHASIESVISIIPITIGRFNYILIGGESSAVAFTITRETLRRQEYQCETQSVSLALSVAKSITLIFE